MSLISSTIANLVNGVSQQPYALRLASQCELQENCNSSVVDGLCPRNGTRHSAKIMSTPLTNAFTHLINRDAQERYRVVIAGGDLKVFDLNGVEKTVNYGPGAAAYIASAAPADDFAAITVADYTFILNKTVTVLKDTVNVVPTRVPEALVWVRSASSDSTYVIEIDGHKAVRTTGDAQNTPTSVATDFIAQFFVGSGGTLPDISLQTALGSTWSNYVVTQKGSFIRVARVDGGDFSISCTDSVGDQAMVLIKGNTQRFTNLPSRAYPGFKTAVQGEGGSFNLSYWVEFISDTTNQYGGVWKESTKPGEANRILASTMPHTLVREADGTFTLKAATWDARLVGDLETCPFPSFVDRRINDVFFHRGRLGFLSDENVILSRSGEFFNFFKTSVIQGLDTDPIDIAASHTKVSVLHHAVPFNESLLLVSDQTQFLLGHGGVTLTYKTASLDQTTEYECSSAVKPVGVGNNIYFVQNRSRWSAVREFMVDSDTQTKDAQDITAHVPKYVPDGVFKIASSNTENMMVLLSHNAPSTLFVYQYHIADGTKLQSAWHSWTFPSTDTVLNADFIESDLHLLISRPDGVYLEKLNVNSGSVDLDPSNFSTHLDRVVTEGQLPALVYDPANDVTSFQVPYMPQFGEDYVLVAGHGNTGFAAGQKVRFTLVGNVVTLASPGNLTHFQFGRTFKARYVFSPLQLREQAAGGGQTSVGEGRINVRRMTITYGRSGYFRVEVTPRGRDTYTTLMTGRQLGSNASLIGQPAIVQGVLRVPVMARNTDVTIELVSDQYLPFSILSADWEAMYVIRSRRT